MRKSLVKRVKALVGSGMRFLQIVTKEPFVIEELVNNVLTNYVDEIIHYDILQGFDVPGSETINQQFAETINKWMYENTFTNAALVVHGSEKLFEEEKNVYAIQKAVEDFTTSVISRPKYVVLIMNTDNIPLQLKEIGTVITAPLMNIQDCKDILKKVNKNIDSPDEIAKELLGLTQNQVETCVRKINSKHNTKGIISQIREQKARIINQSGLISIEEPCNEDKLGGFDSLKAWMEEIKSIPDDDKAVFPKGMLLVGVTGCGKSLAARVTANVLNVPLLRIDFGRLMGKYVGESEKNLRSALQVVEAISHCVLWLDEFEKAFGNSNDSNGIAQRMLGQFLFWMQEHNSRVFTVATVNNVSKLPAELLRRGRFDRIFYVDFPGDDERKSIISIHAKKLDIVLDESQINEISVEMQGRDYSGADIEYLLKEAKRKSYQSDIDNMRDIIMQCIRETTPIGSIMSVEIKKMQDEFRSRGFDNVNDKPQRQISNPSTESKSNKKRFAK